MDRKNRKIRMAIVGLGSRYYGMMEVTSWVGEADAADRYYRYLKDGTGRPVGEIAYHYDGDAGITLANVIVYAPCRGNGYGGEGLELLCRAAAANGIRTIRDDIAADNPAVSMFLARGFEEEYRTDAVIMLKRDL